MGALWNLQERTASELVTESGVARQTRQRLKEEMDLDHFEGRSWTILHSELPLVLTGHLGIAMEA